MRRIQLRSRRDAAEAVFQELAQDIEEAAFVILSVLGFFIE